MKKRVFLATGIAVLSTAVLAACSSGNGNKDATKPVTYAYVFTSDPVIFGLYSFWECQH